MPLAQLVGLAVPQEGQCFFGWDAARRLYRLNAAGRAIEVLLLDSTPSAAAIAADGHTLVLGYRTGRLQWANGEGRPTREQTLAGPVHALALDSQGQHCLVSHGEGAVSLVVRGGATLCDIRLPTRAAGLAFGLTRPNWFAWSAHGYVAAFDAAGKEVWRELTTARLTGFCLDATDRAIVACGPFGLRELPNRQATNWVGQPLRADAVAQLPRKELLAVVATPASDNSALLLLIEWPKRILAEVQLPEVARQLAAGPTGSDILVGLADGTLLNFRWSD